MVEQFRSLRVLIAGWLSFGFAIWVAIDANLYMGTHNTTGSYVSLGFCTAFLSFAAAAFGISTSESKAVNIAKIAARTMQ